MALSSLLTFPERFFNTRPEDHAHVERWLVRRGVDPDFHSWFINWCIKVASNHAKPSPDKGAPGYWAEEQLLRLLRRPQLEARKYCIFMDYYRKSINTQGKSCYTIIPRDAGVDQKNAGQDYLYRALHQTGKAAKRARKTRKRQETMRLQAQEQLGGASAAQWPPEAVEGREEEEEEEEDEDEELDEGRLLADMGGASFEIEGDLPFRLKEGPVDDSAVAAPERENIAFR